MIPQGILLGLSSAVAFGLLEALISFASRSIGTMHSLVLAQAVSAGILLMYLLMVFRSGIGVQPEALPILLLVGAGLGLVNSLANLSLYKGLSIGPVSLVSPISASYGLVTTVLAVCLLHDTLSPLQSVAVVLTLAGVTLAGTDGKRIGISPLASQTGVYLLLFVSACALSLVTGGMLFLVLSWVGMGAWIAHFLSLIESVGMGLCCCLAFLPAFRLPPLRQWWAHQQRGGLLFGVGAMLGFGIEFFSLSLATTYLGPTQPILWSRLCSVALLLIYASHKRVRGWGEIKLKHVGIIAAIGALDTLGMIWYDLGTSQSATSIVVTLSSTYTILPTLVGVVAYRERLALTQWGGVCALVGGVVGLSLAGK